MSECDPADLLLLAREALAHGEPLLADLCLSGARTDTPLRVEILRLLLPLHIRDERTQQAHRDAALLEKLSPADPLPARVRGVLHARAREPAAAAAEFRDALRLATSPELAREIRRELVEQLLEAGELSQARVELDSLLEGAAPSAEALVSNARLLRLEGKPDLALAAAKHACALRPDLDQAHVMAGVLHFDAGQFDQAAVGFEKALRLDPFNAQAHYLLAQVCRRQGRDAQALDHERASREISSATAEIAALKLAIAERPRDRASFERLAHLFEKTGRETEAARVRAAMPPDTH
jgi:Flp pilus assembly protein TadD